jgi:ketosteroid isomerase-like protein
MGSLRVTGVEAMSVREAVVRKYFELLDADKYDELADLFHEQATLILPAGRPASGRQAIRTLYERALANTFRTHTAGIMNILEKDDMAVAVLSIRATDVMTNESFEFRAVDIFTFEETLIKTLEVVFDRRRINR